MVGRAKYKEWSLDLSQETDNCPKTHVQTLIRLKRYRWVWFSLCMHLIWAYIINNLMWMDASERVCNHFAKNVNICRKEVAFQSSPKWEREAAIISVSEYFHGRCFSLHICVTWSGTLSFTYRINGSRKNTLMNREAPDQSADTCRSGPSCSKLTTSLVNDSLKFTLSDTQICWNFLLKKCE